MMNMRNTNIAIAVLSALSGDADAVLSRVASGLDHTLFISGDNTVFATGNNRFGDVGNTKTTVPECVYGTDCREIQFYDQIYTTPLNTGVVNAASVAARGHRSLAIKASGTAVWWGTINSEVKVELNKNSTVPQTINVPNVIDGALSMTKALLLKRSGDGVGTVYSYTFDSEDEPAPVAGLPEGSIVSVVAGAYHYMALDASGAVWYWDELETGHANPATLPDFQGAKSIGTGLYDIYAVFPDTTAARMELNNYASNDLYRDWRLSYVYAVDTYDGDSYRAPWMPGLATKVTDIVQIAGNAGGAIIRKSDGTVWLLGKIGFSFADETGAWAADYFKPIPVPTVAHNASAIGGGDSALWVLKYDGNFVGGYDAMNAGNLGGIGGVFGGAAFSQPAVIDENSKPLWADPDSLKVKQCKEKLQSEGTPDTGQCSLSILSELSGTVDDYERAKNENLTLEEKLADYNRVKALLNKLIGNTEGEMKDNNQVIANYQKAAEEAAKKEQQAKDDAAKAAAEAEKAAKQASDAKEKANNAQQQVQEVQQQVQQVTEEKKAVEQEVEKKKAQIAEYEAKMTDVKALLKQLKVARKLARDKKKAAQ